MIDSFAALSGVNHRLIDPLVKKLIADTQQGNEYEYLLDLIVSYAGTRPRSVTDSETINSHLILLTRSQTEEDNKRWEFVLGDYDFSRRFFPEGYSTRTYCDIMDLIFRNSSSRNPEKAMGDRIVTTGQIDVILANRSKYLDLLNSIFETEKSAAPKELSISSQEHLWFSCIRSLSLHAKPEQLKMILDDSQAFLDTFKRLAFDDTHNTSYRSELFEALFAIPHNLLEALLKNESFMSSDRETAWEIIKRLSDIPQIINNAIQDAQPKLGEARYAANLIRELSTHVDSLKPDSTYHELSNVFDYLNKLSTAWRIAIKTEGTSEKDLEWLERLFEPVKDKLDIALKSLPNSGTYYPWITNCINNKLGQLDPTLSLPR